MAIDQKIRQLGLELPAAPKPVGAYVPATKAGNMVFTSGQLPMVEGKLCCSGKVPQEVDLATAQAAARQAVLNCLAAINGLIGSLDSITQVVRVNVFVNSSAGFTEQAKVANGASELLLELFGEKGRHTRCAIGAAELPLNAPVEVDMVVQV